MYCPSFAPCYIRNLNAPYGRSANACIIVSIKETNRRRIYHKGRFGKKYILWVLHGKLGELGDENRKRASSLGAVGALWALGAVMALVAVVAVKTLVDG